MPARKLDQVDFFSTKQLHAASPISGAYILPPFDRAHTFARAILNHITAPILGRANLSRGKPTTTSFRAALWHCFTVEAFANEAFAKLWSGKLGLIDLA